MNRQQRRAALKQRPPAAGSPARASDPLGRLFAEAVRSQQQNQLADAARLYKRVLALKSDHAEACNNLGCVLHAQGKREEASACFAQSLTLMPQLFKQFRGVLATLAGVLPPIGEAMRRASAAWPKRLSAEQLLGPGGLAAIAADPLLLCMLQSTPVCEVGIERVLTSVRLSLLEAALGGGQAIAGPGLTFCCALAKQCFINEYVFGTTPNETAQADELKAALTDAIKSGAAISPAALAAFAMYQPLHSLPEPAPLIDRVWPAEVDDVLTQQLREPLQELALRTSISSLTPIEDEISLRVRQQYEESPYPRWVKIASGVQPGPIDGYLGGLFPAAGYAPLGKTEDLDILLAGCGTGRHTIWVAQRFQGVRVLAVDLSLSSLCYAKRQTPAALAGRIDYLQGDILKLGDIGRSFDLVDASGVLHHMADPLEGWRILLALVRPGGIMHLGFYSETGRRDVVAARAFIAERGYAATPADIRRCRQDLLGTPLDIVTRFYDFFTTSECRDLLFHVQESRTTIPAIKAFIDSHGLKFIGFDFDEAALQKFRALFAQASWSMTDLDRWHAIETQYPDTFSGMYQLWVQKAEKPA